MALASTRGGERGRTAARLATIQRRLHISGLFLLFLSMARKAAKLPLPIRGQKWNSKRRAQRGGAGGRGAPAARSAPRSTAARGGAAPLRTAPTAPHRPAPLRSHRPAPLPPPRTAPHRRGPAKPGAASEPCVVWIGSPVNALLGFF